MQPHPLLVPPRRPLVAPPLGWSPEREIERQEAMIYGFKNAPIGLGSSVGKGFRRPEVQADPYTVLYVPFQGADGATAFTDLTGRHTLTTIGTAVLDDSVAPPFGTTALLVDGSGARVTVPDSEDFNFGSGDWTIDFFFRPVDASQNNVLWAFGAHVNDRLYGGYNLNDVSVSHVQGGVWDPSIGINDVLANHTWYHYAVEVFDGDLNLFLNGTLGATDTSVEIPNFTGELQIGGSSLTGGSTFFNGRLMNFRVRKGHAAYRGNNFTPPTTFYPGFGA
jgi:hypothetical protein